MRTPSKRTLKRYRKPVSFDPDPRYSPDHRVAAAAWDAQAILDRGLKPSAKLYASQPHS